MYTWPACLLFAAATNTTYLVPLLGRRVQEVNDTGDPTITYTLVVTNTYAANIDVKVQGR